MSKSSLSSTIVWLRRDLRLADNPAITAAVADGNPVTFLFIRDQLVDDMGAAAKWRLGLSLADFAQRLKALGNQLVLRSGPALPNIRDVMDQTGATALHYCRDYQPGSIARDTELKAALSGDISITSHAGLLLFEPWTVETGTGGVYRVYTPFWKAVRDRPVDAPLPAPSALPGAPAEIESESLTDWELGAQMRRGAEVVLPHTCVGELAAAKRLADFIESKVDGYKARRDFVGEQATSRLSENLTYGEISPRQMWAAGQRAQHEGARGAEHFLKEIVWREFAYHLYFHFPKLATDNWREGWDLFPWRGDNEDAQDWRRGLTGEPLVDAAMREMYVTGTMHNRARMITASYLTKHLMTDWRVGLKWFEDCLIDWDPASNAMGWQWVAGCGPDATPFFRIFNPQTQAEKFDQNGAYRDHYLGEGSPGEQAFLKAIPKSWKLGAGAAPTSRLIDLKEGRNRALDAYSQYTKDGREAEKTKLGAVV